jgi:hypothetical protein
LVKSICFIFIFTELKFGILSDIVKYVRIFRLLSLFLFSLERIRRAILWRMTHYWCNLLGTVLRILLLHRRNLFLNRWKTCVCCQHRLINRFLLFFSRLLLWSIQLDRNIGNRLIFASHSVKVLVILFFFSWPLTISSHSNRSRSRMLLLLRLFFLKFNMILHPFFFAAREIHFGEVFVLFNLVNGKFNFLESFKTDIFIVSLHIVM